MCFGAWPKATTAKEVLFTEPTYFLPINAYVRAGDTRFDSALEKANSPDIKISTMDSELSSQLASSRFPKAQTVSMPQLSDASTLLLNVASGKADLTFTDGWTAAQFMAQNPGKIQAVQLQTPLRLFGHTIPIARGEYPVCYISVGTLEDWRPDVARFPADLIGKAYDGWDGEFWLDLRQAERLAPAIEARLDLCREKGFKGVDPDNLDGHETDTGFELTSDTQIQFLTWLAAAAHQRGLSIGLKNVPDLAPEISNQFDWIIIEDCHAQSWCGDVTGFIEHGKPVFSIEYTDNKIDFDAACADANKTGHTLVMKHRALDGDYIRRCDPR